MKPRTVIGFLQALPGKERDLEQALHQVVQPSRQEEGCISYRLHRDLQDPARFILYEIWRSAQEHEMQFQKPYMNELLSQLDELLAEPVQVFLAEDVS